jgi:hypothetical protein
MKHLKITDIDKLVTTNSKVIEAHLIDYVMSLRQDGIAYATIQHLIAPVFTFYQLNDVIVNRKKVQRYLGEHKRVVKDKAYSIEQIGQALQNADSRMRMIILLLASTGCRIGALPGLTLGNLTKLPDYGLYKVTFYEGTNNEYYSFCTRECASTGIENYLNYRQRCGEKLAFNQSTHSWGQSRRLMPKGVPIADWKGLVLPEVKKQLRDFDEQEIVPTLRAMFYTLVQLGVLPNTQGAYHSLSDRTARWRENRKLPIDCFADHVRRVIQDFDDDYRTLEEYIYIGRDFLKNAKNTHAIPRWHNQPNHVEVWLEKDAPVESFRSIVRDRHVIVVPNRGHSSVAFLNENVDRLKKKQAEGKKIYILYFGDADPSGEVMPKVYKRKLVEYGLYKVEFIPLAVTKEQIRRFNLLHDPDPKTLAKLKRDPNKEAFKQRWGLKSDDELFAVELEAMLTPDVRTYIKELILGNIDRLFSQALYRRAQAKKPSPEEIDALVRSMVEEEF